VEQLVRHAMSKGVAWDDLGDLKPEARRLKFNKSSWASLLSKKSNANSAPPAVCPSTITQPIDTHASIIELSAILPFVDEETVVFLDVDNTLLTVEGGVGSEHWEKAMTTELLQTGTVSKERGWVVSCWLWSALQQSGELQMKPCETTAEVVAAIVSKAHSVVGMTARHPGLADCTGRYLSSVGITLPVDDKEETVDLGDPSPAGSVPPGMEGPIIMTAGVIYCTGRRKADAAEAYLRRLQKRPRRVILVDDTVSHLEMVAAQMALRPDSPEFVGFHYRRIQPPADFKLDPTSILMAKVLSRQACREDLGRAMASATTFANAHLYFRDMYTYGSESP